ncbi:Cytochrome P450 67 [Lachnellula arida]|uniref:Cytochrome P450 67 n=1 Tax=Lachnellula arida TaxID=1316785 RepID=A0A8T9B5W2_9HELO|nr:Cytochrome P450 67 [Lachnellula arida]
MAKGSNADGSPWATARSVTFVKDRAEHRARRRIWDQGFTTAALQQYEPRIASLLEAVSDQFASRIGRRCSLEKIIMEPYANFSAEEINFADWTAFFAFDAMGDLGFGNDFGMVVKVWANIPWCKYIVNYLPMDDEMKQQTKQFVKFGNERFDARKAKGTTRADIFSHLLAQDEESGGRMPEAELREDAKSIIIAGSDTTSFALHEQAYKKLEKEIDALNAKGPIRGTTLGPEQAPYVNGVINEALRLFPPAPEPSQRTYGESPYILNGKLIPPHTNCYVSHYTLARDERNFSEADEFIPERWIESSRPEKFNHNARAFVPFGSGLFGCAGRTLAQLELRQFIATLLYRFHFSAGRNFNPQNFQSTLRSNGTMESGGLPLLLTARNVKSEAS